MGVELALNCFSTEWSEIDLAELNGADPLDYYSHNGQTVSPEDSENLHLSLVKFLEKEDPVGVEKYIIEDFINWVVRRNDDGTIMDIPGFLIR